MQLLIGFSVPVVIALYTFVQNNNDQLIALANREKDLEIARHQRAQDFKIAEDQEKSNILAAYESFLGNHLNRYGMTLNRSASARFVARFKTLTAVRQLDPIRKTCLVRSLYEAKLIVNDKSAIDPTYSCVISLEDADLSEISLINRNFSYLSLPSANLTRAKFVGVDVSCVNFRSSILIESDFTLAAASTLTNACFPRSIMYNRTIFLDADMSNSNMSNSWFVGTDFSYTNLSNVDMRHFLALGNLFFKTNFYQADLSFSRMSMQTYIDTANMTDTKLVSAAFTSINFISINFVRTNAKAAKCTSCSLRKVNFNNCVLHDASFIESTFSESKMKNISSQRSVFKNVAFNDSTIEYSDFLNTIFYHYHFIDVNFHGSILNNVSFFNCTFQDCKMSDEQKLQVANSDGSHFY